MPVDLSLIPEALSEPKKCNLWFWGLLLLGVVLFGALFTFGISFFYSVSNLWVWLGAVVFPVGIWILSCLYGVYHRGYREAYVKDWNYWRELRRQQLIDYARRGLYVLHCEVITEYGKSGNAKGVTSQQYALSTKIPYSGDSPVSHSALILPYDVNCNDFSERLLPLFVGWKIELKSIISTLSNKPPIHVRFFVDTGLDQESLFLLWSKTFAKIITPSSLSVEPVDSSVLFIEQWLDDSEHDDELLLVISARLFSAPSKNDAEMASLFLLGGQNILQSTDIPWTQPSFTKIYRTEQTGDMANTLDKTLLWGNETTANYDGVWYIGVSPEQNIEIMNHFNVIKFAPGGIFNIDTSIGYAGHCAYWLALALAIEQTQQTNNRQLIVCGKPDITASVVASVTRE